MKNKEYLEWQLYNANEEQDRKLIKSIIKDLEILDLLKGNAELIAHDGIIDIKINYVNMYKDEFDKIMGWLNERN